MGKPIPVIDLFAGAGGLGEGFASLGDQSGFPVFDVCLSIEKDLAACATLLLRKFFRKFPYGKAPEAYYDFVRGFITAEELYAKHPSEHLSASESVWHSELGSGSALDEEVSKRIEGFVGNRGDWILVGGPPCQTFSVASMERRLGKGAGKSGTDPRTFLYREYLRVISRNCPSVFVLENVKGLISSRIKDKPIFQAILDQLHNPHTAISGCRSRKGPLYTLYPLSVPKHPGLFREASRPEDFIVECELYGIPQTRHRVIIVGVREDVSNPDMPRLNPSSTIVLDDLLRSLPKLRSGLSRETDSPEAWKAALVAAADSDWILNLKNGTRHNIADRIEFIARKVEPPACDRGAGFLAHDSNLTNGLNSWYCDDRLGGVIQHESRAHIPGDLHRYLFASCFAESSGASPTLSSFPQGLLPNHKNASSDNFADRFRVQVFGKPSSTIMSHIGKDGHYYIHPDPFQCRSLTVREAARLQTFPDNYFFCGNRTSQYAQIGNAVPPLLSFKIAGIIAEILKGG